MKHKTLKRSLSLLLVLVMLFGAVGASGLTVSAAGRTTPVLQGFTDPDAALDAKPMLRHWYPDAGAGLTQEQINEIKATASLSAEFKHSAEYLELVADGIRSLYSGGYGGVEMTMLSDGASYSYELSNYIAWGSEAWTRVLTQAVYTANELGDFKVDITMTAHWPLLIDTIDPNDPEQQQQMSSYEQALPDSLSGDYLELELPEQRTEDYFEGFPGGDSEKATFLFVDRLASSVIAIKNADGTLEFDSLTALNAAVADGKGYAAGVPGTKYIVKEDGHWKEYTGEGTPSGTAKTDYIEVAANDAFNINIPGNDSKYYDENGRTFMDDWQSIYQVSVSDIEAYKAAHALSEGQSYVLINSYCQGTGQVCSGGSAQTMNNRNYAINYYSREGAKAVTDYWDEHILDTQVSVYDKNGNAVTTTLRQQIRKNDGALFEDSLEMHTTKGVAWSLNIAEEAEDYLGYSIDQYLLLATGSFTFSSGSADAISRIKSDISTLKEELYNANHSGTISDWSKTAGFQGGYRFQSSGDLVQALAIDIIESDNGTLSNYGLLSSSSTVNLRGDQYHSIEGLTSTTLDPTYFETVLELNMNFSRGINRQIYHGTPFIQSATGIINNWPGWSFNHGSSGYGAWAERQPLWENMDTLSDYVTRVQSLLQTATTKIPVLIVGGSAGSFSELLDYGYHYNTTVEEILMQDFAAPSEIVNGVLKPNGLGTELIVLSGMSAVDDVAFIERMIDYANKGMTIALYNTNITKVNGVETTANNDGAATRAFSTLKNHANTITVSSMEELVAACKTCTSNTISYYSENIELTHLVDHGDPTGTNYYFFYNYKGGDSISWGGVGQGLSLSGVQGEDASVTVTVDANGGTPYLLDAWNGQITELTRYTNNSDGTITLTLDIAAWDTAILAVSTNTAAFRAAGSRAVTKTEDTANTLDLSDADWDLVIRSWGPATDFDSTAAFYETKVSELDVGTVKLGLWENLEIEDEALYAIGISAEDIANAPADSGGGGMGGGGMGGPGGGPGGDFPGGGDFPMPASETDDEDPTTDTDTATNARYLSGIGYYTTTFDWDGSDGAYLYYEHRDESKTGEAQVNMDMVTEVKVVSASGKTTVLSNLNQVNGRVDLGCALETGENTITIKLTTTLRNRSKVEGYNNTGCGYSDYGLTAVSIVPYEAEGEYNKPSSGILGGLISGSSSGSSADEDEVTDVITGSSSFRDVRSGSWYYDAVQYVHEKGLMNGTSSNLFSPDAQITRGMIVTILWRMEGEPAAAAAGFTDVASGMYYADAINWAAANGIVTGYSDTAFGPNDAITREQMAAILYRYAAFKGYDVSGGEALGNTYVDADKVSSYAVYSMQWAVAEGLITGMSGNTLSPQGSATRAQFATILMRFLEKLDT